MDDLETSTSLSLMRQQLLEALSLLDSASEHAAAAHVAAAIDILEGRLDLAEEDRADRSRDNPVTIIVRCMVECFGSRAGAVARRQLSEASGSAFLVWAAIAGRLSD
jgi:hypothetical protein